jgi:hypothetical protein
MLATLAGFLALLLGLSLLLLPLLVTELSRPRDSAWGAVVLLLGLVLVTSAERLTGSPMLAVLCGGLLMGRLGSEVAQGRWRALSDEERQALRSTERWSRSLNQLTAAAASLLQSSLALAGASSAWLAERRQGRSHGKRWVRSETSGQSATAAAADVPSPAAVQAAAGGAAEGEAEPAASGPSVDPSRSAAAGVEVVAGPAAVAASDAAPGAVAASEPDAAADVPSVDAGEPACAALLPAVDQQPGRSPEPSATAAADPGVRVVADFDGVDALLAAAPDSLAAASESETPSAAAAGENAPSPPA